MKNGCVSVMASIALMCGTGCRERAEKVDTAMSHREDSKHTNKLVNETSPYLLQHAHNPVDWYPWGEAAFKKAKKKDKAVFLSIGYSACHWCHVMERESFENKEIAGILNKEFISIKVDREERPDVDEIYMTAVQLMTGSGGWPLSVFLTPDLKPFFGGTYFPPEDRFGRPGFKNLLLQIAKVWNERREEVLASADGLTTVLRQHGSHKPQSDGEGIRPGILAAAEEALVYSFDQKWGGFGDAPKFPPSGPISLLLRRHANTGDKKLLHIATLTLDKMAHGGMYDQIGGGFHRYSIDRQWLVPHFEKMLYDNALLSRSYLEAYQITKRPLYRRITIKTLDYVIREMTDASGGFHSAEDADSEGEEGKYYVWTREEIMDVLGPEAGPVFCDHYGVTAEGDFEGKNILNIKRDPAALTGSRDAAEEELERRLTVLGKKLLLARSKRVRPGKDDKMLSSWNGMMISSLAKGYQVLGEERFLIAADKAGQFVLSSMMENGELLHTYRRGKGKIAGYLNDYANVATALVDLYETSFAVRWLETADALTRKMIELFWDEQHYGFYSTSLQHKNLLTRTKSYSDGSVPSGNAVAAMLLLRMAKLVDNNEYYTKAEQMLKAVIPFAARNSRAYSHMLCAADFYVGSPMEIVVIGKRGDDDTRRMLKTVRDGFLPNKVVAFMDPADENAAASQNRIPLLKRGIPLTGVHTRCSVPAWSATRKH